MPPLAAESEEEDEEGAERGGKKRGGSSAFFPKIKRAPPHLNTLTHTPTPLLLLPAAAWMTVSPGSRGEPPALDASSGIFSRTCCESAGVSQRQGREGKRGRGGGPYLLRFLCAAVKTTFFVAAINTSLSLSLSSSTHPQNGSVVIRGHDRVDKSARRGRERVLTAKSSSARWAREREAHLAMVKVFSCRLRLEPAFCL